MKRYIKLVCCLMAIVALFSIVGIINNSKDNSTAIKENLNEDLTTVTTMPVSVVTKTDTGPVKKTTQIKTTEAKLLSDEEIDLIALVTMGEAEGESELGKRLVIDTILNRVDSDGFPDNVVDVIYQPNAFESMWNGRVDRCYVMDSIRTLVKEESMQRHDSDVVFFCAYSYSDYGTPLFKCGNHYFSSM